MGFLLLGKKDSQKAANTQAAALRDSARAATLSANYQAEGAAAQMTQAQAARAASQQATDLLSRPMESAQVDLATDNVDGGEGTDLLKRRKSTRQTYQADRRSGIVV